MARLLRAVGGLGDLLAEDPPPVGEDLLEQWDGPGQIPAIEVGGGKSAA